MDLDNATGQEMTPEVSSTAVPPTGVRYGDLLPLGTKARSYTRRFIPQNGVEFTYNQRVIRIELNGPMFLDPSHSFLMFDLEVGGVAAAPTVANSDINIASGHDLIERLVITGPDGTELERVDNYNLLSELLIDYEVPEDNIRTFASYTCGASQVNSDGEQTYQKLANAGTTARTGLFSDKRKVAVKLLSGLLGNQRYLPLLALRGSGIVLELHLAQPAYALVSGSDYTSLTYKMTNVEYVSHCIDFDNTFNSTFMSLLQGQGQLQFHGVTFHNFSYATQLNGGTTTIPIAERARSLKALYLCFRKQDEIGNVQVDTLAERSRAGVSQYVFNIGGARFPQAPVRLFTNTVVNGAVEGLMELRKSMGMFTDVQMAGRVLSGPLSAGVVATTAAQAGYEGKKFAIGIDLENFPSDSNILESGFDTLSQALPIYAEITAANSIPNFAANTVYDVQTFSMVDVIYVLSADGLMSASD